MEFNTMNFEKTNILVVGDVMLDQYWFGGTSRISPEAPVPVVLVDHMDERPGGAANVALGVQALGAMPTLLGVVGVDAAALRLKQLLEECLLQCQLQSFADCSTITKLRILSRNQQMIRLDTEKHFPREVGEALKKHYLDLLEGKDAVIISDYGKGSLSDPAWLIHGGIKYALTGVLTGASQAIANMPTRWKECLQGTGEIDLSRVNILSQEQLLWSTGSLTSDLTSFFASKALQARVQKLKPEAYPTVLQHAQFKGKVYRLEEVVLDSPSLIKTLATPLKDFIFKVDPQSLQFNFEKNNPGYVNEVCISNIQTQETQDSNVNVRTNARAELKLHAKRYLLTAGEGNQTLTQGFAHPAAQQCRPLQMVVVKLEKAYPFFAHCLDNGMNPRVTITSHTAQDGKAIWYIGGQLAEEGVKRSPSEQIAAAKKELNAVFPWLDLQNAKWASFYINRAEPKQPDGKRPDLPFLQTQHNIMTAWPTKLALAPLLVDNLLQDLAEQGITADKSHTDLSTLGELNAFNAFNTLNALNVLPKPDIAKPVWDELFEETLQLELV